MGQSTVHSAEKLPEHNMFVAWGRGDKALFGFGFGFQSFVQNQWGDIRIKMENSQHFSFLSCGWNKLKLLTLKQVSGQISGRGKGAGRRQESGARVGSSGPISVPSPQRQPTEETVKLGAWLWQRSRPRLCPRCPQTSLSVECKTR